MKLLVIEDNPDLLDSITSALEREKFVCERAISFGEAEEKIRLYTYDILIVDINLPDGSGLDIIRNIKQLDPSAGVIIVSARNSLDNKLEGLQLGADDYLTKPFDMAELTARVRSLIRRRNFSGSDKVKFGNITICTQNREVFVGESKIELTKSEYEILLFFFSNPNRVLSKERLAEHIWGDHMDLTDSFDFIYSHIKNLRKKIVSKSGSDLIRAIYGIGYKLDLS